MHPRLKFRCDHVRLGTDIVKVTLTKVNGPQSQDEITYLNWLKAHGDWIDGQYYWVEIYPAFPHYP